MVKRKSDVTRNGITAYSSTCSCLRSFYHWYPTTVAITTELIVLHRAANIVPKIGIFIINGPSKYMHLNYPTGPPVYDICMRIAHSGFSYAYGWNIYYQKIVGVCPVKDEGVIARQRAWIWVFLIATFIWLPQIATLPITRNDMNMTIDCLSTNLSITIAIAKLSVLQYQRSVIGSIVSSMAKDWLKVQSKEEWNVMMMSGRLSNLTSKMSFCITNLCFIGAVVSQLCVILGSGDDPDRDPRLATGFILESYFPFDTSNPLIFAPLWLTQTFSMGLAGAAYSSMDCFISTIVFHLCGQLKVVRYLLKNLANETTKRQPIEYWRNLCVIVRRHEQLNRRTYVMDKLFSTILLVQMLVCTVTVCFQGYAMFRRTVDLNGASLPIPVLIFRIFYAIGTMEHLFVCCYVGEKLSAESTSISDAFYETPWYDLAPKEARAFILVCQRADRPLELRAGKFCTFNLQLFNTIMKNSMGYVSMLIAMKDRLAE